MLITDMESIVTGKQQAFYIFDDSLSKEISPDNSNNALFVYGADHKLGKSNE